ncbi:Na+/H+ antiporter subunit D [Exiguobacterium undae]|uniref:Na+/H+ antiporter subunit D n=1 Tax=Exiguobacterium undae TaxID=169177 RepID=A0ABX2VAQ6_9BACL|nr:Na+/H+ antiporter subunit D [Exiguobacterium undae]OAN15246.1 Na+/H+ antiporter subunit D [Exiguobacterium undae]
MINLPLLPILIPLITGVILMLFPNHLRLQRSLSFGSTLVTILASAYLIFRVKQGGILTVTLGSWPAPFGITLVSDMLSALLVFTTSLLVFFVVWYSIYYLSDLHQRFYYYIAVQFLLVGVNGAFTTGDIFNMFVFFEVFLISSYVLIVLGGKPAQLRESLKYLLINVISSALFVMTVAFLYGIIGSLSMADISQKISEINQPGILSVIAILFLIVFGLKGAIFPLYFWLPGSYQVPPTPVLALFGALLTKVGVYGILRTYSLFFSHQPEFTHQILGWLALATILIGVIGALATRDAKQILIYNIIVAVGVILYGVSVMTRQSLEGAVFYLIHDMLIKAALFLLIGVMIGIVGSSRLKDMGGMIKEYPLLGWTYFIAALSLAGIPPLSGFIGKLLIVRGGFEAGDLVGPFVVLISSLLVLYSVMQIFIRGFWGTPKTYTGPKRHLTKQLLSPALCLVVITVLYGVGAEAVRPFISQAVDPLVDPSIYIQAVLKED